MPQESRDLEVSLTFTPTADAWAKTRGLLNTDGSPISTYPQIIGMPTGSLTLGAFNLNIFGENLTIKQALQAAETGLSTRFVTSNLFSEINTDQARATARGNLGIGTAGTAAIGTSGSTVPMLSGVNTWGQRQTFSAGIQVGSDITLSGAAGSASNTVASVGSKARWAWGRDFSPETGGNSGSNWSLNRYADDGTSLGYAILVGRSNGAVSLATPLGTGSGGTGTTSLTQLKINMGLDQVTNTSDANKPVSSAIQTALDTKYDKSGGTINGNVGVVGRIQSTNYMAAGGSSIVTGGGAVGGQLVLGYVGVTNLAGPAPGTWTVGVDASNRLIFNNINGDGSSGSSNVLSIDTSGVITTRQPITGRAYPRRSDGASIDITWDPSSSSPAYVWGSADGGSIHPFSTTSLNVGHAAAADSATNANYATTAGRARPSRSDGSNIDITYDPSGATPTYLWGGADGGSMHPYTTNTLSVSYAVNAGTAANAALLSGLHGGDNGDYIRRSGWDGSNPPMDSQVVLSAANPTNDVWASPLQIREVNRVGRSQGVSTYAPAIVFNWQDTVAAAIKMHSDGSIRFQAQSADITYRNIFAAELFSTGFVKTSGDGGLYWINRNRTLTCADSGASYGTVNATNVGMNGWCGYSINNWITLMANGTDSGLFSQAFGSWVLRFDTSGNAYFPANVTFYSDERLKKNIRPISDVAARRENMAKSAIQYDLDGQERIGFSAQGLEEKNPEVVHTADDILGTKSVSYTDTIAILAADNQQLSDKIDALTKQLADLTDLVNTLLANK